MNKISKRFGDLISGERDSCVYLISQQEQEKNDAKLQGGTGCWQKIRKQHVDVKKIRIV